MNPAVSFLILLGCCLAGFCGGWFRGVITGARYVQDSPRHFFPLDLDDADSQHRGKVTPVPSDEQYAEMTWQRADGTTEVRRYKALPDDEQSP